MDRHGVIWSILPILLVVVRMLYILLYHTPPLL